MVWKQWNLHQSTFQLPRSSINLSITAARDDHFGSILNCWNVKNNSLKMPRSWYLWSDILRCFCYFLFSLRCARLDGNLAPLLQLICFSCKSRQFELEIFDIYASFIVSASFYWVSARENKNIFNLLLMMMMSILAYLFG